MSRTKILVGEQFAAFARMGPVLTPADLRSGSEAAAEASQILVGLGMARGEVFEAIAESDVDVTRFNFEQLDDVAPLAVTHKRRVQNVLISRPRRIAEKTYLMRLLLDGQMDRLLDHVTGHHVSGMVLVEAARQAAIATGEMEYEIANRPEPQGFVWTNATLRFDRFTFPVPTQISVEIKEDSASTELRRICGATVTFTQGRKCVSVMDMGYELRPMKVLSALEEQSARRLLKTLCPDANERTPAAAVPVDHAS
jgi:hypothetical protein